jgi:hypothetical protein
VSVRGVLAIGPKPKRCSFLLKSISRGVTHLDGINGARTTSTRAAAAAAAAAAAGADAPVCSEADRLLAPLPFFPEHQHDIFLQVLFYDENVVCVGYMPTVHLHNRLGARVL